MWIIVATVLLLYLLGFLFICFLNTESHGNPSSSDNNSLSASNNNDETENFCQRHQFGNQLLLNRLISSNLRTDEEEGRASSQARETSDRLCQQSSDLSRSALFAYRQQQLRQIHHEINEMSYLLGSNQTSPDRRSQSSPVPIRSRGSLVQPLRSVHSGRASNYFNFCDSGNGSPYSFVHHLMFPLPSCSSSPSRCMTAISADPLTERDRIDTISDHGTDANNLASNNVVTSSNCSTSETDNSRTYQPSTPPSLSYSPGGSESCYIIQERQRRLRRIRMELEGLSLQLNNSDVPADRVTQLLPPPTPVFYGMNAGIRTHGPSLLAVSSAGGIFRVDESLENSSPLIYFHGRNSQSIINGNSWSGSSNNDDDLPEYESIVCFLDSPHHQPSNNTASQQEDESPPPSYNDAVHLYSFKALDAKRK